mmetsp:Transcript_41054/g.131303  ORF Transcript_41054/g.131303 Transcript_41054/m.131303 type:complete len:330 (+) Transcript_41054:65-1054(+)
MTRETRDKVQTFFFTKMATRYNAVSNPPGPARGPRHYWQLDRGSPPSPPPAQPARSSSAKTAAPAQPARFRWVGLVTVAMGAQHPAPQDVKKLSRPHLEEDRRRAIRVGEHLVSKEQRVEQHHARHALEQAIHGSERPLDRGLLLLHRRPAQDRRHPADAGVAEVLVIRGGKAVTLLHRVEAPVEPGDVGVARARELLARGERAEALLARHHDGLVLVGQRRQHGGQELAVGAHVLTAQPPAAHPKCRHLLEQPPDGRIVVHHEQRHVGGADHSNLLHLFHRADVEQGHPVLLQAGAGGISSKRRSDPPSQRLRPFALAQGKHKPTQLR